MPVLKKMIEVYQQYGSGIVNPECLKKTTVAVMPKKNDVISFTTNDANGKTTIQGKVLRKIHFLDNNVVHLYIEI